MVRKSGPRHFVLFTAKSRGRIGYQLGYERIESSQFGWANLGLRQANISDEMEESFMVDFTEGLGLSVTSLEDVGWGAPI